MRMVRKCQIDNEGTDAMRTLRPNIYSVGAIDWDARLFDRLIPLPDGTSYNAYVVRGSEKTVLIDTVDPAKTAVLLNNIVKIGVDKLDYIIAHHGEQDHSGSLSREDRDESQVQTDAHRSA